MEEDEEEEDEKDIVEEKETEIMKRLQPEEDANKNPENVQSLVGDKTTTDLQQTLNCIIDSEISDKGSSKSVTLKSDKMHKNRSDIKTTLDSKPEKNPEKGQLKSEGNKGTKHKTPHSYPYAEVCC